MGREISNTLKKVNNIVLFKDAVCWEKDNRSLFTMGFLVQGTVYSVYSRSNVSTTNIRDYQLFEVKFLNNYYYLQNREYETLLCCLNDFCQENNWELIHYHEPRGEIIRRSLIK
jgi:hypothetical protein